ncbi:MAG: hypothetical protein PG979_001280 [Rickettsia asembonensis]|nr:MAG: hypothetical protein PG979_001280 [Rickettsia asembonensis]
MQMKTLLLFLRKYYCMALCHSRFRGNDIKWVFRAMQQFLQMLAMTMMLIIPGNATALFATCNQSVPTVNFGTFNVVAVRTTSVTASVTCSALLSLLVSYTVTFSTLIFIIQEIWLTGYVS